MKIWSLYCSSTPNSALHRSYFSPQNVSLVWHPTDPAAIVEIHGHTARQAGKLEFKTLFKSVNKDVEWRRQGRE